MPGSVNMTLVFDGMDNTKENTFTDLNSRRSKNASAFEFLSIADFVVAIGLPQGRYSHKKDNLSELAMRLGYKSPSTLTMVIKEQRIASKEFINSLVNTFKLSSKEKEYLELLREKAVRESKGRDLRSTLEKLQKYRKSLDGYHLELSKFETISNWYYSAISQMSQMSNFVEDPEWISRQLIGRVKPSQVKTAIEQMLELEILERKKDGKLYMPKGAWRLLQDIPSSAIRNYHSGLIQQAYESLEKCSPDERHVMGVTLPFDSKKMIEAKEFIQKFVLEFNRKFANNEGDKLEQLNVQFFPLTKEKLEQKDL